MIDVYKTIIKELGEGRVKKGEMLKNYTSIKIGGPADLFFKAQSIKDLTLAVKTAQNNKIDYFILGGGTNIIFSDSGFRGLIIKNETNIIRLKGLTGKRIDKQNNKSLFNKVYLEVDSGVTINRLVRITIDQGLSGLENFLGQPGTVGGAVWINAHNVKSDNYFGDLVISANIFKLNYGLQEVANHYFHFSYDNSIIQKTFDTVLSVTLELIAGNKEELWRTAKNALLYRQQSQPSGVSSAGCLFRNIDKSDALRIATPNYTCSAGYLLDAAGLKGAEYGQAKLSDQHANFLLNLGSAKSSDVLELINLAKRKVKSKFGINLKLEVILLSPNLNHN